LPSLLFRKLRDAHRRKTGKKKKRAVSGAFLILKSAAKCRDGFRTLLLATHHGAKGSLAFPALRAIPWNAADAVGIFRLAAGAAPQTAGTPRQNHQRNPTHYCGNVG
jgi:hypothetical protein